MRDVASQQSPKLPCSTLAMKSGSAVAGCQKTCDAVHPIRRGDPLHQRPAAPTTKRPRRSRGSRRGALGSFPLPDQYCRHSFGCVSGHRPMIRQIVRLWVKRPRPPVRGLPGFPLPRLHAMVEPAGTVRRGHTSLPSQFSPRPERCKFIRVSEAARTSRTTRERALPTSGSVRRPVRSVNTAGVCATIRERCARPAALLLPVPVRKSFALCS